MLKVDNSTFKPTLVVGAGIFKQAAWYVTNSLLFKSYILPFSGLKILILRLYGANIGRGVVIKPGVNIKYPWKLTLGDFSWIGEKVWIDNLDQVRIGNSVTISQGSYLLTGNHDFSKTSFELITGAINIAEGGWIGAQAVVCPGVQVGTHAVLTVGSVATKNLEAYGIYQGNPAIRVKERVIRS
jgi:putative colanic acid biosynthesis acetyltransferase WcaF